ncbi:hypothetical protein OMK64_13765 [Cellulomonas fimi]|uniref:hypothetical protein n=1 Tax=Cellulomonas fimi TaxID=1708 RepID=UPI00234C3843|nr:hypothetical protein [Cellulomonas fimi]MDC7122603.1 hypothetical protein [Cellulomonas fimi]
MTELDPDLVAEIENAATPDAQIPYSMMELTNVTGDQRALELFLLDLATDSSRAIVRSMAVECMGHLVRERGRLTTDRVPLLVCEVRDDADEIMRDNARVTFDEIRYWLSPRRRGRIPLPTDSVQTAVAEVRLVVTGDETGGVVVGEPDDPAVWRIADLVGAGVEVSPGFEREVLAALNLPNGPRGLTYQHINDARHVPWYAWAFGPGGALGAVYVPPRLLRLNRPHVSARRVRTYLREARGARLVCKTP